MTMSQRASSARPASVRPRPSAPRSISRTESFSAARRATASSPSSAFRRLNAGLESTSGSSRSAAGRRALARMARLMRPTSGIARRVFSTIDLPRKPVVPVTRMVLPFKASAIKTNKSIDGDLLGLFRLEPRKRDRRRRVGVGPAEIRPDRHPEPVGLTRLAREPRRPGYVRPEQVAHGAVLRHVLQLVDVARTRAVPRNGDEGRVARIATNGHADLRQRHVGESRRASEPQVAEVLGPRVGTGPGPTVRIDRAAPVFVVHAEMQVRTGRGAGHAGETDDLSSLYPLTHRDVNARKMAVVREQPVAVHDLDRQPAQARVARRHRPARQLYAARSRRRHRFVVEPDVVAVVAVVVEVVVLAWRLRVAPIETGVGPADRLRDHLAVPPAQPPVGLIVGIAVVEQRGDVVSAHEGQREERPPGGRLVQVGRCGLKSLVWHLARVEPAAVVALALPWGPGLAGGRWRRGHELKTKGNQD